MVKSSKLVLHLHCLTGSKTAKKHNANTLMLNRLYSIPENEWITFILPKITHHSLFFCVCPCSQLQTLVELKLVGGDSFLDDCKQWHWCSNSFMADLCLGGSYSKLFLTIWTSFLPAEYWSLAVQIFFQILSMWLYLLIACTNSTSQNCGHT